MIHARPFRTTASLRSGSMRREKVLLPPIPLEPIQQVGELLSAQPLSPVPLLCFLALTVD
jgi:hypothetical protein